MPTDRPKCKKYDKCLETENNNRAVMNEKPIRRLDPSSCGACCDYVPEKNVEKIKKVNSKRWYELAQKQTFKTLPAFNERVLKAFPAVIDGKTPEEELYTNKMFAGILITLAAFHATSNAYGFSCNNAGVVRNCFYLAVFDEFTDYLDIIPKRYRNERSNS